MISLGHCTMDSVRWRSFLTRSRLDREGDVVLRSVLQIVLSWHDNGGINCKGLDRRVHQFNLATGDSPNTRDLSMVTIPIALLMQLYA